MVTDILHAFDYQGYSVYFDNWYTSPTLLHASKEKKFSATGALHTNRQGIPSSVLEMKVALSRADVPRATGYYIRGNDDVYVYWQDNNSVCVISNEHTVREWQEELLRLPLVLTKRQMFPSCSCKVLQSVHGRSGQIPP